MSDQGGQTILPSVLGGKRWLIIVAHPDDESKAAPLLVRERLPSDSVTIVIMRLCGEGQPYDRDQWTREVAIETRSKEMAEAAHQLRAGLRYWLEPNPANPGIVNTAQTLAKMKSLLAECRPDRVVTHWSQDNHPDHIGTSSLVTTALEQSEPGKIVELYQFGQPGRESTQPNFQPNHYVPICNPTELAYVLWARFIHRSQTTDYLMPQYLRYYREHGRRMGQEYGAGYVLTRYGQPKES